MIEETPRLGHNPIRMRRRLPDLTQAVIEATPWTKTQWGQARRFPCSPEQVGDFYWDLRGGKRTIVIALPYAQENIPFVATRWTIDHKNHCDAQWSWDGNEDAPTLNPSLHWVGAWHGWCRDGMLVEA